MNKKASICVIGLGYIGLPTYLLLSEKEYLVKGVEKNNSVLKKIKDFKNFDFEKDVSNLILKQVKSKKINIGNDIVSSDFYIICVPTPYINKKSIKVPDLKYLMQVVKKLTKIIKNNDTVIIESTIPVGTTNSIANYFKKTLPKLHINVVYCPERVLPGNIVNELTQNDRIVGGLNSKSSDQVKELYRSFVTGNIYVTDSKTAEMSKLVENSYRDVNIAFANEISQICSDENISVNEVIKLANKHPRVQILNSSIGVGGHCIPVDPWFLISKNLKNTKLIKLARVINDSRPNTILKKINAKLREFYFLNKKKPRIAIFGLTYKKNTNDIRNSPALTIVKKLNKKYKKIILVDRFVKSKNLKTESPKIAIDKSNLIIILVAHDYFKKIINKQVLKNKTILDYSENI